MACQTSCSLIIHGYAAHLKTRFFWTAHERSGGADSGLCGGRSWLGDPAEKSPEGIRVSFRLIERDCGCAHLVNVLKNIVLLFGVMES